MLDAPTANTTAAPTTGRRLLGGPDALGGASIDGPARWITLPVGGSALQPLSVRTRINLGRHPINEPRGTLMFWMVALEDLHTAPPIQHIEEAQPGYRYHALFTDTPGPNSWTESRFAWVWGSHWYPQWFVKFYRGSVYPDAYRPYKKAFVAAGHFSIDRLRWTHCAVTWDRPGSCYRMYANGVLIATEDQFVPLVDEPCGLDLYCGNPAFALADVEMRDEALEPFEIAEAYRGYGQRVCDDYVSELERTYAGRPLVAEPMATGSGWETSLKLSLDQASDLEQLYVQGCPEAVRVTPEGLQIDTPDRAQDWKPAVPGEDPHQLYLWTRRQFEGDLDLRVRFKPLRHRGLMLLMTQASGMHGEDFMTDYPLRTTGSMRMVYGENVRNYHWEFFREMGDARNDTASNVLVKNPWMRPLAYRCLAESLALDEWHALRFLQIGRRLQGFLNEQLVFDVEDRPGAHAGPVYRLGHVAIRAMIRTSAILRDLEVRTRNTEFTWAPVSSLPPGVADP